VLSAKQMGAERIIMLSHYKSREKLAREFGATDIVAERGDEAVARIKEMTAGMGADAVLECAGTREAIIQAIRATRPGGSMSYVGVPHGVSLEAEQLFFAHVHLHGGPAPVRWTNAARSRRCCGRKDRKKTRTVSRNSRESWPNVGAHRLFLSRRVQ
jgi:threonine dehydrogenase-like Zn-dependent dehydrogenase